MGEDWAFGASDLPDHVGAVLPILICVFLTLTHPRVMPRPIDQASTDEPANRKRVWRSTASLSRVL